MSENVYITAPVPTPAEAYEIGRHHEKERIIKLLEDYTMQLEFKEWVTDELIHGIDRAIALIKGENNADV